MVGQMKDQKVTQEEQQVEGQVQLAVVAAATNFSPSLALLGNCFQNQLIFGHIV